MPTRKAFFGRRWSTRTTSGCLVCRRRRVKCDENKPECQRCTKAGFRCEYGVALKWPVGGAKPGNNRSRRPPIILLPRMQEFAVSNSIPKPLDIYPPMSDHDKTIFHFYTSHMCPQCRLRDGNNNLYRQIIIPIAFESDLLRRSVLAVGANRLNIQRTALHHEAAVLRALQGLLSDNTSVTLDRHPFPRVEILAVVLLLCFYELDSPSDINSHPVQPWRVHMQGAQHIIQNYLPSSSSSSSLESGMISFLAQYFAARCTLTYSATHTSERDHGILNSAKYWLALIDRPTREINLFAGCSNELLALLLTVTQTANSNESYEGGYMLDGICGKIQNVRQDLPLTMQSTKTSTQAEGIAMTAEAFRLATLVIIESLPPYLSHDVTFSDRGVKTCAISSLFELLTTRTTPLLSPCGTLGACSYLWPYYIASRHMMNQDERDVLHTTVKGLKNQRTGDSKDGTRQQLIINHILLMLENTRTPLLSILVGSMATQVDPPLTANHGSTEWS